MDSNDEKSTGELKNIEEYEEKLKSLSEKDYTREESEEKLKLLSQKDLNLLIASGLCQVLKNTHTFDFKLYSLFREYSRLNGLIKQYEQDVKKVESSLTDLRSIKSNVENHDLFKLRLKIREENTPITSLVLEWVINSIVGER